MSDVQSPKPSDETRDASKAKGATATATATSTAPSTDDIDIAFGDPDPPPAPVRVSEPAKSAALRSTDPNPISQREIDPAPSAPQRTSSLGDRKSAPVSTVDRKSAPVSTVDRKSAPASKDDRPTAPRIVEVATSEQKKLEDIRRKLKDIFVTAEKPEATSDVVKASEQQTVSSGLLDLRHLAEARHGNRESKTDDDDLMNMSGGLFGSARGSGSLAAPDFSKPTPPPPAPKPPPPVQATKPVDLADEAVFDVDPEPEPAPRKPVTTKPPSTRAPVVAEPNPFASPGMSSRTIVALTLAGALVFGGVFFMVMRGGGDDATQPTASTDSKVESQPAADQGQRVGQPASDTPPAADPGGAAVVPGSKPASGDKPSKSGDGASTKGPGKTTTEPKDPKEPAAPTTPKPEATTAAPATAAPAPTEPPKATPPPAGNEFDRSAASAAMSAAASRAMACKGDGPAGTASVSVTFAPSGRVTSAKVEGGPFSGTPTGGCIATAFRSATVPPFDGSPLTVRKTVSIR